MQFRYRYRIEPTQAQRVMLARTFGCARVVFNDAIRCRDAAYRAGEKISRAEVQRRVITQATTTPERAWLDEVASVALVQSVNDAHRAYQNFFDSVTGTRKGRRVGRPRLKSRKDTRQSFRLTRNGFTLRPNGRLSLAKIGDVRVRWSRDLPSQPSSVTIVREPDGHYYASFVVEMAPAPLPELDHDATETGIDLGLSSFAVLRIRVIDTPRFLRRAHNRIVWAQRRLSRTQKGSRNRAKARRLLARHHTRVRNQRADFIGKQVTQVIRESQAVYLETLNLKGMARNFGRSVHDQALGAFTRALEHKARMAGRWFWQAPRDFPSTQLCSTQGCGQRTGPKGKQGLTIRVWTCTACGTTHDRDRNAEKNLRAAGRAERLNACGAGVRLPERGAVGDEAGTAPNAA